LDADDEVVGAVAFRAAGAVGDGDEGGLEFLEAGDGAEQFLGRRVGLGREELEAEGGPVLGEDVLNVHGAARGPSAAGRKDRYSLLILDYPNSRATGARKPGRCGSPLNSCSSLNNCGRASGRYTVTVRSCGSRTHTRATPAAKYSSIFSSISSWVS